MDSADPADATAPKVLRLRARWDGGGAGGEPMEAPAGFDGGTNGLLTQEELKAAQMAFEEREEVDGGLGPVYNAQSCVKPFEEIGCALCHVATIVTAPPGATINGGAFVVPPALGNKAIHPFGDFLLHDIGTGDGIVQNGGQGTANKLRTPPLWGVRTRTRLMHDGSSLTFQHAILRHGGEARFVTEGFRRLGEGQQQSVVEFLKSL